MRKKLASWLLSIAKRLDPQKEFILADKYGPKKLGIGYHITKKEVQEYRKHNPQFKSHRKALAAMIEDTKKEIGMNILAGAYRNELIHYEVKKSLWVADVTGDLYVYAKVETTDTAEN
jgi:hypothetical protein